MKHEERGGGSSCSVPATQRNATYAHDTHAVRIKENTWQDHARQAMMEADRAKQSKGMEETQCDAKINSTEEGNIRKHSNELSHARTGALECAEA